MLENNKISTCVFSEELVSYLYDELTNTDKSRFESHLGGCQLCSEELSEFSMAHSAILEWRNEEFLPLPAPVIEIPYDKKPLIIEDKSASLSWVASIRNFFTLSPPWITTAGALAALTLFVGISLIMFGSLPDEKELVVKTTEKNDKIVPVPTTGVVNSNTQIPNPKVTGQTTSNAPKTLLVNSPESSKETAKPVKSLTVPKQQNLSSKKQSQPAKTNKSKPVIQKNPGLIDDEEDDGLRLSDLLDEISMYSERDRKEVNK